MEAQVFWNDIGALKNFEDPLYIREFAPFLNQNDLIVEYGCGYGRMLQILKEAGFHNLIGYDFAPQMIKRGRKSYPELDLRLLDENAKIPHANRSCDAIVMSTVLCCMVEKEMQSRLFKEIQRVLKPGAALYLTDFLICSAPYYNEKYQQGYQEFQDWGVYTTSEELTVRHHTTSWIMELLTGFDIQWFKQFDFKTMNQNAARTFHCVALAL